MVLVFGGFILLANIFGPPVPCEKTLTYGLGEFDSRFGVSREQLIQSLVQAEAIWEKPTGFDLFAYDPNGELKINLIYDERQEQTRAEYELRKKLDSTGESYNSLVKEHATMLSAYERDRAPYESRLVAYNSQLSFWNSRGGAPRKEFEELEKERQYLQAEQDRLNEIARQLNSIAEHITTIAERHNLNVTVYNQQFAISRQFDQADYRSRDRVINVYQYGDLTELRLALAHELGHALGLEHVEEPEAIMYYLMERQDQRNPALKPADVNALKSICRL